MQTKFKNSGGFSNLQRFNASTLQRFTFSLFFFVATVISSFGQDNALKQISNKRLMELLQACESSQLPPAEMTLGTTLCQDVGNITPDMVVGQNVFAVQASAIDWGGTVVSGRKIAVYTTLLIDQSMIFSGCTFIMEPDARIIVTEDNLLLLNRCRLFSCDGMWKGIHVQSTSTLAFWKSHIEDAEEAIKIEDSASGVSLIESYFNRNMYGIVNGSAAGGDGTINFYQFKGNTFDQTSVTNAGGNTLAHIKLTNTTAAVIPPKPQPNHFNRSGIAIVLDGADFTIRNAHFLNQKEYAFAGSQPALNDQGNNVEIQYCTFEGDCNSFIQMLGSNISIKDTQIKGTFNDYAIESLDQLTGENMQVERCSLFINSHCDGGILTQRPLTSSTVGSNLEIIDNWIELADPGTGVSANAEVIQGVYVFEPYSVIGGAKDMANLTGNAILMNASQNTLSGIAISTPGGSFNNYVVKNNTMTASVAEGGFGAAIFMNSSGKNHEISENTLTETIPTFNIGDEVYWNSGAGIYLRNPAGSPVLCHNTFDGTNIGLQISGDNGNALIRNNNFGQHSVGLDLAPVNAAGVMENPIVGTQTRHGNNWSGNSSDYELLAARYTGSAVSQSKFLIEATPGFCNNPVFFPPNISFAGTDSWFKCLGTQSNWCATGGNLVPGISEIDRYIAALGTQPDVNKVTLWEEQRRLLKKMLQTPDVYSGDEQMSKFLNEATGSSALQFAQIELSLEAAWEVPAEIQGTLDALRISRHEKVKQLDALAADEKSEDLLTTSTVTDLVLPFSHGTPATLATDTDPRVLVFFDADVNTKRNEVMAEIASLRAEEHTLKSSIQQLRITNVEAALLKNATLPDGNAFELRRKQLNEVKIRTFLDQGITDKIWALIKSIKTDDSGAGGLAVEEANTMYPDCGNSVAERFFQTASGTVPAVTSLNIVPNPTMGSFRIELPESVRQGTINVYDVWGRMVKVQVFDPSAGGNVPVILEGVADGVYLVTVSTPDHSLMSSKIVLKQ